MHGGAGRHGLVKLLAKEISTSARRHEIVEGASFAWFSLMSPQAWQGVGRVCAAPADYDGICSAAMDFESYSLGDKRHWTLMCGVDWYMQLSFLGALARCMHLLHLSSQPGRAKAVRNSWLATGMMSMGPSLLILLDVQMHSSTTGLFPARLQMRACACHVKLPGLTCGPGVVDKALLVRIDCSWSFFCSIDKRSRSANWPSQANRH